MEKYLCIHGHFYQPPRENPWLESVELQDSAAPFHDWNERITRECYGRNTAARILDGEGRIREIVNNYSRISFNFGPTLLAWMKDKMSWVHDAIVDADRLSQERFSGHGSAIAQVYNHMIMPLANRRDKETQVIWGIRDFESRFGRMPEGMWLAETAADIETLDVLAQFGIKFTILSPYQAAFFREIGAENWESVDGGRIDPARPYLAKLPSGRSITIFFYDAPVSQAVAFEKLLDSGERFANRLLTAFSQHREGPQLVHIGTDGESYGHHHHRGEMALAYALKQIEEKKLARLTNYGEFLEKHPPRHEVSIHEKSAWSCSHGVGRWMENCGCNSGGHDGWNQNWRAPLRMALDWLRDQSAPLYEERARTLLKDPWQARNDYINVILDRSPESLARFFESNAQRQLSEDEQVFVLKLMEIQRHELLMYTSCGWFFDELSGLETVQVIQYAARAIQLASDVLGFDFEEGFLSRLENAKSNIPDHKNGRRVYEKFVKPARISWDNVVAHYAISSIFSFYGENIRIFLYDFHEEHRKMLTAGRARLVFGRTKVTFQITRESKTYMYAALYLGEHNVTAGVMPSADENEYNLLATELRETFDRAEFPETIRVLDRHLGPASYSLRSLFKDEQRRIINEVLDSARQDLESRYRLISERYTPLIKFLDDLQTPLPGALKTAADFIIHIDLLREFKGEQIHPDRLRNLIDEARPRLGEIFDDELTLAIGDKMFELMRNAKANPEDLELIRSIAHLADLIKALPMDIPLWPTRNVYWKMAHSIRPEIQARAAAGDANAAEWLKEFATLGDQLGFGPNVLA